MSVTPKANKTPSFNVKKWGRGDSNPHASLHQILSLARLPVPALPRDIITNNLSVKFRFI
jgi:hypothetical protein